MESVFITKVFALTEEILRGAYQFEPMRDALQNHLAKAQKMGSLRYEAEALNTLGILYLLAGNSAENIQYFLQGLEKARQTDDNDLKIKLFNNLTEAYLGIWDFESANRYLDQGIALGKEQQLTTLAMLYVYSNKINYLVLQGDFVQAGALLDETWHIAENPDLLKYSKYEYLQVIFLLRNLKAVIEIALGHCKAAAPPLQIAVDLAKETQNPDFNILMCLSRLYDALICKRDEASAAQWEQAAIDASGGQLPYSSALSMAFYLMHNHQPQWAQKYADIVLAQAADGKPIPAAAVAHAGKIQAAVRQMNAG